MSLKTDLENLDPRYCDEIEPEAEPAPEVEAEVVEEAPEPQPEPELEGDPVKFDWLDDIPGSREADTAPPPPPQPQPPPMPPPGQYPQQPPQQYQQQPQYPPQQPKVDLDAFLQNPEAALAPYVQSQIADGVQQALGLVDRRFMGVEQQTQAYMQARAHESMVGAKRALEVARDEVFNKDSGFRGSKKVQNIAVTHMRQSYDDAVKRAGRGDPVAFQELHAMQDPMYPEMVLANAKIMAKYKDVPTEPIRATGTVAEGAATKTTPGKPKLAIVSEDFKQELNARFGKDYGDRYEARLQKMKEEGIVITENDGTINWREE